MTKTTENIIVYGLCLMIIVGMLVYINVIDPPPKKAFYSIHQDHYWDNYSKTYRLIPESTLVFPWRHFVFTMIGLAGAVGLGVWINCKLTDYEEVSK